MKITLAADIRKLQVSLPDTAEAIKLTNDLFAKLNAAAEELLCPSVDKTECEPAAEMAAVTRENTEVLPEAEPEEQPMVYVPESAVPEEKPERKYYSGLFHIVCSNCGSVHDFGVKKISPISRYICNDCKSVYDFGTEMELVEANITCPNCREHIQTQTNDTGDTITLSCISCKSPIDAFWNGKKRKYVAEG